MLRSLDRWLTAFENICLATGMGVAVVIATIQVILRYFADTGIYWAEEVVVYTIVWTAFLSAGAGVRSGEHLSVELINLLMRGRLAGPLARIIDFIGVAAGIALAVLGTEFVKSAFEYGQRSAALELPMWIVYLCIPLAGLLLTIRFIQRIVFPPERGNGDPNEIEVGACR
jgi:C4-dicarboxylate transporter DctQ subunit